MPFRKRYYYWRFTAVLMASFYLLGGVQQLTLEGLHELSHALSHLEFHHHHEQDHHHSKLSHHHEVIEFLSKILPKKHDSHDEPGIPGISLLDKHVPSIIQVDLSILLISKNPIFYHKERWVKSFQKVPSPPPKDLG
ncbi:MAG: hypothetical protein R2773_03285 [Flavobacteriaceae bacterium]